MAKTAKLNQQLKIFYDNIGNTLTVWLDDPKKEVVSEEADDDVVLMKDKKGRVIGFEKLNVVLPLKRIKQESVPLEVVTPAI